MCPRLQYYVFTEVAIDVDSPGVFELESSSNCLVGEIENTPSDQ